MSHQLVWNPVLTSWPPSSQRSSTDHWNCAKSLHASNAPPSSPSQRNPKLTRLNDYRPVALTSVVMKSFEKLVLAHLKDITGPSLDPLQFAYRANRSVDDAVNMGLHYVLQHLDRPGAYVRILFVDFSSAFKTIIPNLLLPKLTQVSMPTSICQWINRVRSALELLKAVFSAHCSSPCTWTNHIKRPLCQATKVFRQHHTDRPHPGRWQVCLQRGG